MKCRDFVDGFRYLAAVSHGVKTVDQLAKNSMPYGSTVPSHQPVLNPRYSTYTSLVRHGGSRHYALGKLHISVPFSDLSICKPYDLVNHQELL
jgi:hypothetical protein